MTGCIKTTHLTMTVANMCDLPELEGMDVESDRYFMFDPPSDKNHACSLETCLTVGDVPPGVSQAEYSRDRYIFYCIRRGDALIGYLSCYLEYRKKDTAYLSVLYIKEAFRGMGLGGEVVDAFARHLAAACFTTIRLHCSLRNAMGLRFWVKNGFDRISAVNCDGNLYPGRFGGVELVKSI